MRTMEALLIISTLLHFGYIITIVALFGVPSSISHSYYLLQERFPGAWKYVFYAWTVVTAFTAVPIVFTLSEGNWFQFMGLPIFFGLLLVGCNPDYKIKGYDAHITGALMTAVFACVWVCLKGQWMMAALWLVPLLTVWLSRQRKNLVFWAENAVTTATYAAFYLLIFKHV